MASGESKKKPSKKKVTKKKVAKKSGAKKKAASKSDPRIGKTSQLSLNKTWIQVFEQNEQVEEGKRLNDAQISEFMKSEFPELQVSLFDQVEIARAKYNRGGFHPKDKKGKLVKAKIHSRAHTDEQHQGDSSRNLDAQASSLADHGRTVTHQRDFKSHKK
ncbi:MAG: hypothetical protein ACYTG5_18735 [Planctomycetota bacterium]|jgi:hypothetical protein